MRNLGWLFLALLNYLLLAGPIFAHVQLDYPSGGESFVFGQTVNVRWHIQIAHDQENWDLYFSPDSGNSWQVIQLNLDPSQLDYQWTMPQIATEYAQIRIDMDNTTTDYSDRSNNFTIRDPLSLKEPQVETVEYFTLYSIYPNPFNPSTTIRYELSVTSHVELMIYNQLGQEVRLLVREQQSPDFYRIQWDGHDNAGKPVGSGVYIYCLTTGAVRQSRKMVLLR